MNKSLIYCIIILFCLSLHAYEKENFDIRTNMPNPSAELALKACDKVALTPCLTSAQPLITANPATVVWVNTSDEKSHFLYNESNRLPLFVAKVGTSRPNGTKGTTVLTRTNTVLPGRVMNERGSVYQLLLHKDSVWIDAKNCGGQATVATNGNFKNQYVIYS
jgi:hypothetical protein